MSLVSKVRTLETIYSTSLTSPTSTLYFSQQDYIPNRINSSVKTHSNHPLNLQQQEVGRHSPPELHSKFPPLSRVRSRANASSSTRKIIPLQSLASSLSAWCTTDTRSWAFMFVRALSQRSGSFATASNSEAIEFTIPAITGVGKGLRERGDRRACRICERTRTSASLQRVTGTKLGNSLVEMLHRDSCSLTTDSHW